jgi:structural maintenance of chromosomes protein 6
MNQSKSRIEKEIAEFEAEIEKENRRLAAHSQARHDELQARINNLTGQINTQEAQLKAINAQKAEIQSRVDDAKGRGLTLERSQADVKKQLDQIQGTINQAKQAASDQYVPYGNRIQDVLKKIGQTKWHGEPPVGPLGLYVKAKDSKMWGDILRVQLAGLLTAFAITDPRDRPVLKKILSESRK